MDISIDMLSLGNADGIIVWLKEDDMSGVIVIDGGAPKDGQNIIDHLEKYILPYVPQDAPDLIISTHPDKDHVGGLIDVVEYYGNRISEVWVNNPADHCEYGLYDSLKTYLKGKSTDERYNLILKSFENLENFIKVVDSFDNIIRRQALYPLSVWNSALRILGPSQEFYNSLLPGFSNLERYITYEAESEYNNVVDNLSPLLVVLYAVRERDTPCPIVDENNNTTAENNSSVIIEINRNDNRYLLTGDAGVQALNDVHSRTSLNNIYWLDVPHHGSRRNLSSVLIDIMKPKITYISAKGDRKHPRKALVNCLKKAGTRVYGTNKSRNLWHHRGNFPDREDYSEAEEL